MNGTQITNKIELLAGKMAYHWQKYREAMALGTLTEIAEHYNKAMTLLDEINELAKDMPEQEVTA